MASMEELPPKHPIIPGTVGEPKSSFSNKPMRAPDVNHLELGDEFTIPKNFQVFTHTFNNREVEYIRVQLKNGKYKDFYPAIFYKFKSIVDDEGIPTGKRAYTKGTATDLFLLQGNLMKGMEALKGRTLRITNIEFVKILPYGGTNTYALHPVLTIDLVD